MESLEEFKQFLNIAARLDLKSVALTHILNLTGNADGRKLLHKCPDILQSLVDLTQDSTKVVAKDAVLTLVNIAAEEAGANLLVNLSTSKNGVKIGLIQASLQSVMDPECEIADFFSMLLSNLSRPESLVNFVLDEIDDIEKLLTCFTRIGYNTESAHLNYLGPIFSNITQCSKGRELVCNRSLNLLQRILPFVNHKASVLRRGGAIGVMKNVCFDSSRHDWLLGPEVDILPSILLPLIGPEVYDDEDNEKFPLELQFLDSDKTREEDADLRKMLLESLSQLCATKKAREFLRSKGTYEVLRELHKWEVNVTENKQTILACENVVDILLRTEEEIGEDNLKEVEIPDEMMNKIESLSAQD